jgi:hypothetical protein
VAISVDDSTEHAHFRCNIDLRREIEPVDAALALELLDRQILVGAAIPRPHVHPGRVRVDPDI